MSDKTLLEQYIEYIDVLQIKLDSYFEDQKEFLACKSGCDNCCISSYYPCSALEYEYARIGLNTLLNEGERQKIYDNAINILKARREFLKTNEDIMKFSYSCPFLVNKACCIYKYRPFICRTHGLIYNDSSKQNKINLPYCVHLGLNYAILYDKESNNFRLDNYKDKGFKSIPTPYDLSYSVVMKDSGIPDFGDIRMIFEWIIMDIPNYEELIKE